MRALKEKKKIGPSNADGVCRDFILFYKRLCTIKLYFVDFFFFFSFASFDLTLFFIILMMWIPQIRVSGMMH